MNKRTIIGCAHFAATPPFYSSSALIGQKNKRTKARRSRRALSVVLRPYVMLSVYYAPDKESFTFGT
ncbi:hypothetical protein [Paenibacillus polymyxa]|uniref:hypothetical protein n=1 Tax=Paenibacillus polymyxa TaxID=1406 RepID=UPI0012DA6057|nr:hypothetical protein [Paenibacillus polymyxa]